MMEAALQQQQQQQQVLFGLSEEDSQDVFMAPVSKPKRQQVKNACTNCQKACKKCDDGRPCQRCIKYGLTETCVNSQRKERKKGMRKSSMNNGSTKSPQSSSGNSDKRRNRISRKKSALVSDSEGENNMSDWYLEDEEEQVKRSSTRVLAKHLHIKEMEKSILKLKRTQNVLTPVSRETTPRASLNILSELCAAEINALTNDETDDDGDILDVVRTLFSPPETPTESNSKSNTKQEEEEIAPIKEEISQESRDNNSLIVPIKEEIRREVNSLDQESERKIEHLLTEEYPRTPFSSPVMISAPVPLSMPTTSSIKALSNFADLYFKQKELSSSSL